MTPQRAIISVTEMNWASHRSNHLNLNAFMVTFMIVGLIPPQFPSFTGRRPGPARLCLPCPRSGLVPRQRTLRALLGWHLG